MAAYGYQHRVLMTGTPLQNNTNELFSLLNFIEPAKFPDADKFAQAYGTITTQEQVEHTSAPVRGKWLHFPSPCPSLLRLSLSLFN